MERLYVAYGSNMNKAQMRARCPRAKAIGKGILHGYTLEFRGRSGHGVATIIKNRNTSIPVVLWSITEECEKALDVYEGFPTLYYKKDVKVEIEGEEKTAMVYIMAKRYEDKKMSAQPSDYYYGVIRQGYRDFGIEPSAIEEALIRTMNASALPQKVREEIIKVSKDARTNMFDIQGVIDIALELGCTHLVDFLLDVDNHGKYANFIIYGD